LVLYGLALKNIAGGILPAKLKVHEVDNSDLLAGALKKPGIKPGSFGHRFSV